MPIKIDKKLKLKEKYNKVKPEFHNRIKKIIADEILYFIKIGVSPVKGGGDRPKNSGGGSRFVKYSKSYLSAIKRGNGELAEKLKAPVNLFVTGKLYKSIRVSGGSNKTYVSFDSPIAKYHNELGAGKAKTIRRLLPTGKDEEFSKVIQNKIVQTLKDVVKFVY